MEVAESAMTDFIKKQNLYSMIKTPTCFKGSQGRCIDLCLTNKRSSFINTQTFETGFSDFHEMIYTMFKTTFVKLPPKVINYRSFKHYNKTSFYKDLLDNLFKESISDFDKFEEIFQQTFEKHAPLKKKKLRGNNKPFMTKDLNKDIATRSRLRNIANKTGQQSDILRYKKQRNFVKYLNLKTKRNYYKSLDPKTC